MTTLTEVMDKVESMKDMGASKTSANQMIRKLFEYKSFKSLIDEAITTVYGDTTIGTVDWVSRVETIRNMRVLGHTKKDIINQLVEDEGGHKASITQMMGYIQMCEEWARQEIEEDEDEEVTMEELEEVIETINKA